MKLFSVAGIVLLLVCASGFAQDTHPGGIVYGPKAAFTISAPAGWKDGHDYFINEYLATKSYSQWERVAYVQLPRAVAYIVLSSRDEASYRKDSGALQEALKTFMYLETDTKKR